MSANQQVTAAFEAMLGNSTLTQAFIESFFESQVWLEYPDESTWDQVMLNVAQTCVNVLTSRILQPAHFGGDE